MRVEMAHRAVSHDVHRSGKPRMPIADLAVATTVEDQNGSLARSDRLANNQLIREEMLDETAIYAGRRSCG